MGIVYRAVDHRRGETVALKTMKRVDPLSIFRFKQEFRTLADLSHPNLISLYELVYVRGQWFFTMELLKGSDFIAYLRRERELAEAPTVDSGMATNSYQLAGDPLPKGPTHWTIFRLRQALPQLVGGVRALHNAGKLHRDIKPSNVMVTEAGRVVLMDFGLVTDVGPMALRLEPDRAVVGTIGYLSPEQAAGLSATVASDWYSVGVMIYQALTGRLPFGGSASAVLRRKQVEDPSPPSVLCPGIPDDLNDLCLALMAREPAERPDGQAILGRLGQDLTGSSPGLATMATRTVRLIGRESHREAFEAAYRALLGGNPLMLLIKGRSGSGKSTLLQSILDGLEERGEAVVLSGRCYERESVPYKALDNLIDALTRYLIRLPEDVLETLLPRDLRPLTRIFPVLLQVREIAEAAKLGRASPPDRQELRRRAFAALRELFHRLGDRSPLVLAIDDLQWGDADSAALLVEVLSPPDAPILLLLGTYRLEDELNSPFLQDLLSDEAKRRTSERRTLTTGPLTPVEARELAMALLDRDDTDAQGQAQTIAEESEGNPFFVLELAHAVLSGCVLNDRSGSSGRSTLDDVLWDRIGRLPEPARRLLHIVAVSGRPIRQDDALEAADLKMDGRPAASALRAGRLIRVRGAGDLQEIEAYHDRIRECVASRLDPETRRHYHGRLAATLEARHHADPEALAVHYHGSGDLERAGRAYLSAAYQASEALAFEHAARLYRQAIELLRPSDPERRTAIIRLADALANAGRGAEAARAYLDAIDLGGPNDAIDLRRKAATQFLISGHVDEGLEVLRTVLDAFGMRMPANSRQALRSVIWNRIKLRLRGLRFTPRSVTGIANHDLAKIDICWSVVTGLSIIDPIFAADFQSRGLLLALRAGEPFRVARSLAMEAAHVSTAGGKARRAVERLLEVAVPLQGTVPEPYAEGILALGRGIAVFMCGEWQEALATFDHAEAIFRDQCIGASWEINTAVSFALWSLHYLGRLDELSRRWPVKVAEARERGDLYSATNLSTYTMAIVKLAADDPSGATRLLDDVMGLWSHQGYHIQHHNAQFAHTAIELYRGNARSAWDHIREQFVNYRRSMLFRVQKIRVDTLQIRARCALATALVSADPEPLLRAAERDAVALERERMHWSVAQARLIRAGIASARGRRDEALVDLREAVDLCEAASMYLYAMVARRRMGEIQGGAEGDALFAESQRWMISQSIRDPGRFTDLYAPGFST
jgi:tetratricopeptide (TPR) repeat protein